MPKRSPKADSDSVLALVQLLRRIIGGSHTAEDNLVQALRSQSSLAAYSCEDRTVSAMSLNHQKFTAGVVLGDFAILDRLRREALSSLTRRSKTVQGRARPTRRDVENTVALLKRECQILREDLFLLQRAFDIRCLQARRYALAAGEPTNSICAKEQLEIDRGLSLRRILAEPNNVVQLRGKNVK